VNAHLTKEELSFAQGVVQAITWRRLLVALTVGLTLGLGRYVHWLLPDTPSHALPTQLISFGVGALCILVAAVTTDEAARRGLRVSLIFPLTLLGASVLGAVVQWLVRSWLDIVDSGPGAGPTWARIMEAVFDDCIYGGLAMMAFLQRQSAQRLLQGIRSADLARVQIEHNLIESRMATTRAQLDPNEIFGQLTVVRNLYASGDSGADEGLESLIRILRSSVAQGTAASLLPPSAP
jgi:hypothetical protein